MKTLKKTASFTDIHWGAKNNSEQHNNDCMLFINWFCDKVRSDPTIDSIIFLGDWFEQRTHVNISTMNWSYHGAKKLNELGLPVYFIIGNHDLYHRHTRDITSTVNYREFNNFTVIDHPIVVKELGAGVLLCPYLFAHEYPSLDQYLTLPTWWGHFEFKGFVVTGQNQVMHHGPSSDDFAGPTRIFSGHFHKRQSNQNIVYIGNAVPSSFGDANDYARGMMVYNHTSDQITFIDWEDCPKYTKVTLSELVNNIGSVKIYPQSRVRCYIDVSIEHDELSTLRKQLIDQYDLREFSMEESMELQQSIETADIQEIEDLTEEEFNQATLDELVLIMLKKVTTDLINPDILCAQYNRLKL